MVFVFTIYYNYYYYHFQFAHFSWSSYRFPWYQVTSRQLRYPSPFLWFLLFPINKLFVMAEYHRRVMLSLDTFGIFYWLFRVLLDDRRRHNFFTIPQTHQLSFPVLIFFDFSCSLRLFKTYSMVKWGSNIYFCAAPFPLALSTSTMSGLLTAQFCGQFD